MGLATLGDTAPADEVALLLPVKYFRMTGHGHSVVRRPFAHESLLIFTKNLRLF
jgi:hypothetical protein